MVLTKTGAAEDDAALKAVGIEDIMHTTDTKLAVYAPQGAKASDVSVAQGSSDAVTPHFAASSQNSLASITPSATTAPGAAINVETTSKKKRRREATPPAAGDSAAELGSQEPERKHILLSTVSAPTTPCPKCFLSCPDPLQLFAHLGKQHPLGAPPKKMFTFLRRGNNERPLRIITVFKRHGVFAAARGCALSCLYFAFEELLKDESLRGIVPQAANLYSKKLTKMKTAMKELYRKKKLSRTSSKHTPLQVAVKDAVEAMTRASVDEKTSNDCNDSSSDDEQHNDSTVPDKLNLTKKEVSLPSDSEIMKDVQNLAAEIMKKTADFFAKKHQ